jgi:hypothetical protein
MNDADWDSCAEPRAMLEWLRRSGRADERKLRLFACSCCRPLLPLLKDRRARQALSTAERYAEGKASGAELRRARQGARQARLEFPLLSVGGGDPPPEWFAYVAVELAAKEKTYLAAPDNALVFRSGEERAKARASQCAVLRCLYGNPFRPLLPRPFPSHVVGLARACHDAFPEVSPEYLVLADALSDLGEDVAADHCREATHAKGCYLVDWVLGRG